jgi:Cytochrome c, mono- and diheme variants
MKSGAKIFAGVCVLAGVAAIAGFVFYQVERRPEASPVARGAALAAESGCFACHGPTEEERRPNSRQLANGRWRAKPIPTLWENGIDEAAVLKDWIANGVPEREAEEHKRLFIQMPAYRSFLSEEEIDAVAAWILAEGVRLGGGAAANESEIELSKVGNLTLTQVAIAGDRLSRQHGCYACHGELGQGGVRNPASFKGYIPGFFGKDFLELTDGGKRGEIAHWIEHGRGRAIESGVTGRVAKKFLEGQAIGMPAYKDRLNAAETAVLVEYLLWLNGEGPLDSSQLERLAKDLTGADSR